MLGMLTGVTLFLAVLMSGGEDDCKVLSITEGASGSCWTVTKMSGEVGECCSNVNFRFDYTGGASCYEGRLHIYYRDENGSPVGSHFRHPGPWQWIGVVDDVPCGYTIIITTQSKDSSGVWHDESTTTWRCGDEEC